MPKRILPLSDLQISKAKAKDKDHALFDGGGLYLLITPTGGKLWRLKYRFNGKNKLLALGAYPEVSLSEARQKRTDARKLLVNDSDPGEIKKAHKRAGEEKAANSFEVIAREWFTVKGSAWSDGHKSKILRALEKDVFSWIGASPVSEITAPELLKVLRRVESRAPETAHRLRWICSKVFKYAIATDRADRDPATDLQGTLTPFKREHFPAVTDPKEVAPLLRAIDDFNGSFVVKCALRLAPILFARPGELRKAEWTEIDLDAAEWSIPAAKMKMKVPHLVPLPLQAVEILKELYPLTGHSKYVFPSLRSPLNCMSDNTMNAALRRMGIDKTEMTAHGFRAMARTILDEVLGFPVDHIEHQLAHAVRDANGRAYNRTSHLPARRQMMQQWADYLDGLKAGAKVIPIRHAG